MNEEELVKIIKNYIKNNYGENEASNPAYDIKKLAKNILEKTK